MPVNFGKITLAHLRNIRKKTIPQARWRGPLAKLLQNVIQPIALGQAQVDGKIKMEALALQGQLTLALMKLPAEKPANIPPPRPEEAQIKVLENGNPESTKKALRALLAQESYEQPVHIFVAARNWIGHEDKAIEELIGELYARLPNCDIRSGGIKNGEIDLSDKGIYGITNVGGRKNNQDGMAYVEANGKKYLLVADGVGGAANGEVASDIALSAAMLAIENGLDLPNIVDAASKGLRKYISDFKTSYKTEYGYAPHEAHCPDTTLAILEIGEKSARVAHIGDSLIVRSKYGGELELLTAPDSVIGGLARLEVEEKSGEKDTRAPYGEDYLKKLDAGKNNLRANVILQSLGKDEIDITVTEVAIKEGDRFLVLSDGLQEMTFKRIKEILTENKLSPVAETARELMNKAVLTSKDNITLFLFEKEKIHGVDEMGIKVETGSSATKTFPSGAINEAAKIVDTQAAIREATASLEAKLKIARNQVVDLKTALQVAEHDLGQATAAKEAAEGKTADALRAKNRDLMARAHALGNLASETDALKETIEGARMSFKFQLDQLDKWYKNALAKDENIPELGQTVDSLKKEIAELSSDPDKNSRLITMKEKRLGITQRLLDSSRASLSSKYEAEKKRIFTDMATILQDIDPASKPGSVKDGMRMLSLETEKVSAQAEKIIANADKIDARLGQTAWDMQQTALRLAKGAKDILDYLGVNDINTLNPNAGKKT